MKHEVKFSDVINGSNIGYIVISYQKLVEAFGLPNSTGDDYKIDAEWILEDCDSGNVFRIYNWKDGVNYCGEGGTPTKDIDVWNIGANDSSSTILFLGKYLNERNIDYFISQGYGMSSLLRCYNHKEKSAMEVNNV
ncbi:MAG: hypothetical protein Unbinned15contig1001_6 [Prokaryotic dsDNA virus sp.]|nr:MAG: hypothetical protein Unbinned15contig1001_6 [Prokaryotic dsDNA virus sp.]|tara:strand:+ start:23723 stop:24130 length:408 start_codon:yes stop_codon:yes gene_type:complete